ncbi:MAG: hypothetical protein JNK89_01975, partial [Saprospiraceae bacterium]|nr:hypothetical protein [Saprospiraceae bacterium]
KNALFQGINPDFDYSVGLLFPDTVCQDLEVAVHFFQGRSARIVNDLFPNEIRPLCVYDSLLVQLSPGYAYQPGSAFWKYQLGEMPPVPAQLALADPVAVSLSGGQEGLLFLRPAQLPVTDYYAGRAEASLHFRAQVWGPPDTSKFPVDIAGRRLLATLDALNLQVSTVAAGAPDFNELRLSALAPLAHTRTPHWQVEMCNSGPSFAIETPLLVVENGPALVLAAATDLTGPAPQSLNLVPLDSLRTAIQVLQLEPNSCRTIEITGSLTGCQTDTLRLRPAFQCADAAGPCILEHPRELYFSPRDAIAQIIVDGSPDSAVALCQALDYSVKIINVGEGFLYDLEIALGLPAAGQTLAPGSAVLEYNGQQAPLPDPVAGPDGLLRWTVDFSQLPFGLEALPSVLFLQSNAIALHFQINTDCAYLDGTRLLYGCSWRDACGPRKNSSLFVAPPLVLQGAPTATNDYQINLELENPASFCAENTLRLVVLNPGNLGATQAGEKLRLVVPAVFSYVPGSLQNLHNGPAGPPVALPFGDQRYLLFDLPAGVAGGDSLVFTLGLQRADSIAGCQAVESFRVQMTQTANVACLNSSCAIDFVLLEKTFIQIFEKPEFQLGGLSGASLPLDAGLENWQLNFNLENTSSLPGGGALQLEIRLDDNQNAALDASDPLLQVFSVDVEGLAPGAMQAVGAQVNVAAALGCSGLWVMLTDTLCSCSTDTVFIPFVRQENAGPDTLLCAGWPVQLGFVPQTGASYAWQPASPYLSDPLAANPQYLYAGPFGPGFEHQETLVLKTTRVQGCISFDTIQLITRQVQLSLTPSPALCAGDSTGAVQALVLGAADPVLYSWNQGQGTALDSVPAGQYALTVTDADGCTAAASAEVTEPLP